MTSRSLRAAPLALAMAALALGACGSPGTTGDGAGGGAADGRVDGKLAIVASFYPLQFATQQIGGDFVAVTSLTRPGAEPHDVELTPRDVASVSKARLVVYQRGLQGAVDHAVESQGGERGLDVSASANLDLTLPSGGTDPHFWLDPQRYSGVAAVIAERLAVEDPAHRADYERNAVRFSSRLDTLGQEFTTGLSSCRRKDIVTSHSAFGYLADRFGMSQIPINGLSPDEEPRAGVLATVSAYARTHGVTTIYAETLVSPAIAETVARETGATMATLDPIEGLTEESNGKDYFEVMRANLKTLRTGQGCT